MSLRRLSVALASALAAACLAAPATAAVCGARESTHSGVQAQRKAHGVAGRLTLTAPADVRAGHVAAWVGVGFVDGGPGGTRQWLQIGVNATPGSDFRLYYEFARLGHVEYRSLRPVVPVGATLRLAVLEIRRRPNWWRVWLNGKPVSEPIFLPQSHGAWEPQVTAESWTETAGTCNRYAFRFSDLKVATRPGGAWRDLSRAYSIGDARHPVTRVRNGFVAVTPGWLEDVQRRKRRDRPDRAATVTSSEAGAADAPETADTSAASAEVEGTTGG